MTSGFQPFDLATTACLLLLVERENEINAFPESPPDRYNRESFFNDIKDNNPVALVI